ncbi:MAG: lipid A deacylase LpxR family protein, partial [Flavobacteriaceae bacterium]|nr:lipid A deacylase LpxR family protein [Flavobacteriaceae bacterium]
PFYLFLQLCLAQQNSVEVEIGSDNDYKVSTAQTDRYYTYGVDAAVRWRRKTPHFLTRYFANLQQSMSEMQFHMEAYTPEYLNDGSIDPNEEHPYAGYSYFKYLHTMAFPKSYIRLGLDVGILGPASQAGKVQNWFHRTISNDVELQGWSEQLPNQFAFNLQLAYAKTLASGKYTDLYTYAEVMFGNIYVYGKPQLHFRFGKLRPIPYSLAQNNQLLDTANNWELFLDFGFGFKLSVYNATLQGQLFDGEQRFTYKQLNNMVYNGNIALGMRYKTTNFKIVYHVATGELHSTETHRYAAFSLAQQF